MSTGCRNAGLPKMHQYINTSAKGGYLLRKPESFFKRPKQTGHARPQPVRQFYLISIECVRRMINGSHKRPDKGRSADNSGSEPA